MQRGRASVQIATRLSPDGFGFRRISVCKQDRDDPALRLLVGGGNLDRVRVNGRGRPHLGLNDMTPGRYAVRQPHVSADDRALPDGDAP